MIIGNKRRIRMFSYRVKNYSHLSLIVIFLILIGCSPAKTVFYKTPDIKIANYQIIEMPNFNKNDKEWVPYDSASLIPDMVAEKLRTSNHFNEIIRSESNIASRERVLLVKGTVTGYKPGCKFCEFLAGRINDKGKSSVSVRVKLIDKTTGDVLADAEMEGRAKNPGTGSSRYTRVVDEIVKLISNVSKESS